tara:strand:+ start:457 stop:909 length:453 start_codon:yes stop_codon:yes gene_type:complete
MVPFPDRGPLNIDRLPYDNIVRNYERELYKILDKFSNKIKNGSMTYHFKIFKKFLGEHDYRGVKNKWFARWKEIKYPDPTNNIRDLAPVIMTNAFVPKAQHDVYPFEVVISHVKYHKDRVGFHVFRGRAFKDGSYYGIDDEHYMFKIALA